MNRMREKLTQQQNEIAALANQLREVIEAQKELQQQMEALRQRATSLGAALDAKLAEQAETLSSFSPTPPQW